MFFRCCAIRSISRFLLLAFVAGFSLGGANASEPVFPTRAVTLVVPYAPGGSGDISARYLAQQLSLRWKREVIVDNRTGAGGLVGAGYVAAAPADGHTLLYCDGSFATNAAMRPTARGGSLKDFAPVVLAGTQPYIMVANPSLPVKNLQEFITYARSRPGKLNYASGGSGASTNLAGEMFKKATGTHIVHIPFRGGGPAVLSVVSGEAEFAVMAIPSVMPFVKGGRLKALAVTGERRSNALPEVPTVREAGLPSMTLLNWAGVLAPSGTPPELVRWLNAEITAVVTTPEVRTQLESYALNPAPESPERTTAFLQADIRRWTELIKTAKIAVD